MKFALDCVAFEVLDRCHCVKLEFLGDGMEERETLHEEKICTKCYVAMVIQDWGRDTARYLGGSAYCITAYTLAFDGWDIQAVYYYHPPCIVNGDWAVGY